MKVKFITIISFLLAVAIVGMFVTQCVSLKAQKAVVREAGAPGESTLNYTPPPEPKLPVETISRLAGMRELLKPKVDQITDDIYLARGFALGSVIMIITAEGLVIIDTTESPDSAKEILHEFRRITDKPIRYIIYTHSHLDHILGAPVFMEQGTQIIATKAAVTMINRDYGWLKDFVMRSRQNQSGRAAPEYALKLPMKSPVREMSLDNKLFKPTITFDEDYTFTLGGKKFELHHTMGETPDHLMVWLPDEKALFSGDLYYSFFPNLSTPMLEARPVREWYQSIDRMIAMKPSYLVPSHTAALIGEKVIAETLTNYSRAIRYVYDETVKGINAGKDVEELAHSIKLPDELSKLPYLQEGYGTVSWSVRGIYRGLTGWYDGRGTGLNPLPAELRAREILKLAGGPDKVLARAIELQKAGEHQLVCELCDIVIAANPKDKLAHIIKASSLDYLGMAAKNLNMFGFYRSAAALERQTAERK